MSQRILLIEDDEVLSEMYNFRFTKAGYQMVLARDGEMGIKLADEQDFDLILSDIFMPKIDGYQVLEKLRKNKKTSHTKIYMLSNLGQDAEIQKALDLGADGYLIKSRYTPSQLLLKIDEIFHGNTTEHLRKAKKNPVRVKKEIINDGQMPKGKILLIEDEEALIGMYSLRLRQAGYSVETAKNGAWGINKISKKEYDLIVLDMIMPAMNGYEALKKIRNNPSTKNIPILFLSNSAQEKDIVEAKAAGATSYLLKASITPTKLIDELERIMSIKSAKN
jgi:CheY-like chemotaxis protein